MSGEITFVVVAALSLAACGGSSGFDAGSDAGTDAGAADAPPSDGPAPMDGGDGGATCSLPTVDVAAIATVEDFYRAASLARCLSGLRCRSAADGCDRVPMPPALPGLVLHPAAAQACVRSVLDAPCAANYRVAADQCVLAVQPASPSPVDGPCVSGADCTSGRCTGDLDPFFRTCGVCVAPVAAGGACTDTEFCANGLYCGQGAMCRAPGGAGTACGGDDAPCLPPLACVGTTCGTLPGPGAFCASGNRCAEGAMCDMATSMCVPRPSAADGCLFECGPNLVCTGGRCRPFAPTGCACVADEQCFEGYCDATGVCARLGAAGDACTVRMLASTCGRGICDGGTCQLIPNGQPCVVSPQCADGLTCAGASGSPRCAPVAGAGGSCASMDCAPGLTCLPDADGGLVCGNACMDGGTPDAG